MICEIFRCYFFKSSLESKIYHVIRILIDLWRTPWVKSYSYRSKIAWDHINKDTYSQLCRHLHWSLINYSKYLNFFFGSTQIWTFQLLWLLQQHLLFLRWEILNRFGEQKFKFVSFFLIQIDRRGSWFDWTRANTYFWMCCSRRSNRCWCSSGSQHGYAINARAKVSHCLYQRKNRSCKYYG